MTSRFEKVYKVYRLTKEGRLVDLEVDEDYGYKKDYHWRSFQSEESALEEVVEDLGFDLSIDEVVILPQWTKVWD